jgi:hypothetical protein
MNPWLKYVYFLERWYIMDFHTIKVTIPQVVSNLSGDVLGILVLSLGIIVTNGVVIKEIFDILEARQ